MPLRNDLLDPIPGENPSGQNLKYAPVFDKIKEARREDDDAAQGEWKRERKLADWPQVIKLAGESLATKTKDLQLAVWLTEALIKTQGIGGLREGLDLVKALLEGFWDTLYPEIEDGDLELRAAPLEWVGSRLGQAVKDAPITRGRLSWFVYTESRKIPTEAAAGENESRAEARSTAIAEGKIPPEEFDAGFESSPKAYYVQLSADYEGTLESLQALDDLCAEKFQDVAPGFGPLRNTLEEVQRAVRSFLQKKREKEPDEPVEAAESAAPEPAIEDDPEVVPVAESAAAPVRARKAGAALSAEPADRSDAIARVLSAAKFLRGENQYDPAPYLLLRGLRWGELRAAGSEIDASLLAAPPSDLRQDLKRLALEGNWTEVLEAAERGMGMECGRGWLDLQRYVGRACYELGSYYEPIRIAVISGVRGFLADYPQLPELTLMDDTPTANAETKAWLKEHVLVAPAPVAETPYAASPYYSDGEPASASGPEAAPDTFDLAMQAARSGRPQEGIEMLMREMAQERNGRARFHRKVQLTQLCISTGHEAIAVPILQELAAEIDRRKLEDWESPELLAQPLALLYRCLAKDEGSADACQKLYSWICRLDPVQAMNVAR